MPYINGSRKCQNVVGWAYFWCIYRAIWFVKWGDLLTMTFYIEMTFQFQIYGCFTIKPIVLPLKNWLTVQNTGTKMHGVVPNITYLWTNNCSELPHWSGFTLYSTGCMHRRHGTRIRVSAIINCMVQYDYTELHYCVCMCYRRAWSSRPYSINGVEWSVNHKLMTATLVGSLIPLVQRVLMKEIDQNKAIHADLSQSEKWYSSDSCAFRSLKSIQLRPWAWKNNWI